MIYTLHCDSPVGVLTMAQSEGALVGLWIQGQRYFIDSVSEQCEQRETPLLKQTKEWLARYFDGDRPEISELPLAPKGGEFRQTVWKLLCEIPYGQTATYGEIAQKTAARLGREQMSAQAVGGAVGHNPISIIIPCHRVVGTGGSLTGYAGGLAAKVKLLTGEGVDMSGLYLPKKGTKL